MKTGIAIAIALLIGLATGGQETSDTTHEPTSFDNSPIIIHQVSDYESIELPPDDTFDLENYGESLPEEVYDSLSEVVYFEPQIIFAVDVAWEETQPELSTDQVRPQRMYITRACAAL